MSSSQESKLPFLIIIPFVFVIYLLANHSGAPVYPKMPGVQTPQKTAVRESVDLSSELEAIDSVELNSDSSMDSNIDLDSETAVEEESADVWD